MAESSSFSELWERARGGDRDAQADLYLEYGPHLRRVVRMKLRDLNIEWAAAPNDLLNSFFIRLFDGGRKISIKDALHFTNYCEQALRNKCVTVLRTTIPRLAIRIDDCPPELLANPPVDIGADWDERLAAALSLLMHRERLCCWLAAEGHAWGEIGQRLNLSTDAVRMIHHRAEQRVRREVLAERV